MSLNLNSEGVIDICGITGFYASSVTSKHMSLFCNLLLESSIRGLHATGVYNGNIIKQPGSALHFLETRRGELTPNKVVIGHCRYDTSGDYKDNRNTQPLKDGRFVLVHNGIVSMNSEFAKIYSEKCLTNNDSEVILRRVAKSFYTANMSVTIAKSLESLSDIEQPIYACVIYDEKNSALYLVRDDIRPLHLYWINELSAWYFTSTHDIFLRSIQDMNLKWEETQLDPFCVYMITEGAVGFYLTKHKMNKSTPYVPKDFSGTQTLIALPIGYKTSSISREEKVVDYRVNRREAFIDYYVSVVKTWDVDPAYPLLRYLFNRYELSREQEYWACWLYGIFYHVASVHWLLQEFPDLSKVDLDRLKLWHDKNWRLLQYETDRRHEKGLFIDRFISYKEWLGGKTQEERFSELLTEDPYQSYRNVWKECSQLRGFGRYAMFYYTEALARCIGLPILCDKLPLEQSESSRNGLCYALKREDLVDCKHLTKSDYKFLYKEQQLLIDDIKKYYPDIPVDFWLIETAECAFKGLYRKRRYIGYYIDRLYEEINAINNKDSDNISEGIDWQPLEDFRNECLESLYVNKNGINQASLDVMMNDGRLVNIHQSVSGNRIMVDESIMVNGCEIKTEPDHKLISLDRKKNLIFLSKLTSIVLNDDNGKKILRLIRLRSTK